MHQTATHHRRDWLASYALKPALLLAIALLSGCEAFESDASGVSPDSIREAGELVVLTRNSPTTVFEDRDGLSGMEYLLTQRLAEALGVEPRYVYFDSIEGLLRAIENGEGHIAAAGLTRTVAREARFRFGPDYQRIQQQLVCHRNGNAPSSIESLGEVSILVPVETSYVERLDELKQDDPTLSWETTATYSTEEIFQMVAERTVDCTVADSNIALLNRRYLPELDVVFAISEEQPLAWVLPPGSGKLANYLDDFFDDIESEGTLARFYQRSYGHIDNFDYVDLRAYARRIEQRLPKYRPLFERAGEKYGIAWTLLAAQAYQESHWDARAKSPTGVRGIMMLTLTTAKEVGVSNRLDPEQSIMGGARYLDNLIKRMPEDIPERDRIWHALIAYNVGMGHFYDARELARRLEKDPNKLLDLLEILPLLSRKEYYTTLRYGYARGTEPVQYLRRVRDYQLILEQTLANREPAAPSTTPG